MEQNNDQIASLQRRGEGTYQGSDAVDELAVEAHALGPVLAPLAEAVNCTSKLLPAQE
jgi:hypothetical protein